MYCTQADIESRFGVTELIQLTDRARTGVADATAIANAIDDAEAEIDGYLAGRYELPFSSVPPVLTRLSCDIALYHLFSARRGGGVIEDVRNRYKDAVRVLENISTGKITLGAPPAPAGRDDVVMLSSAPSVWSRNGVAADE